MRQKYCKQKKVANADPVNSLMKQWNTLHQHAQYRQKHNT